MKREIKIVMSSEDNSDIDTESIRLYIDDRPIGCIQEFKILASALSKKPIFEITFPDLAGLDIDPTYRDINVFRKDIKHYTALLKTIPSIKVNMKNIDDDVSNTIPLAEVGTDGYIDLFPMRRRHE